MAVIVAGGFLGILPTTSHTETFEIGNDATSGPTLTWEFARAGLVGLTVDPTNSEWDSYTLQSSTGPVVGTMTQHASGVGDLDGLQPDGDRLIPPGDNAYNSDAFTFTFDTTSAAWRDLAIGGSINVTYTIYATERGGLLNDINDSDTYEISLTFVKTCFAADTLIHMADGSRRAAVDIQFGDVVAVEGGARQVRWVGRAPVMATEQALHENLRPVRIRAGALGNGLPYADLTVSQQHRILVTGPVVRRIYGVDKILIAAKFLCDIDGIDIVESGNDVTYVHIMFDDHQIVTANGVKSESFFVADQSRTQIGRAERKEIARFFPELAAIIEDGEFVPCAPFARGSRAQALVQRCVQKQQPLQSVI